MRRFVAFLVLLVAIYIGLQARGDAFGMIGPVIVLVMALVAFFAGAVVLFNLGLGKSRPWGDSGFGMSEPVGVGIGTLGLLLFAIAPLLIAAKGMYQGVIPPFGPGPDVLFAQRPAVFLLHFSAWIACGAGILWLTYKVVGSRRAGKDSGA